MTDHSWLVSFLSWGLLFGWVWPHCICDPSVIPSPASFKISNQCLTILCWAKFQYWNYIGSVLKSWNIIKLLRIWGILGCMKNWEQSINGILKHENCKKVGWIKNWKNEISLVLQIGPKILDPNIGYGL